jgi:hypothetical protein
MIKHLRIFLVLVLVAAAAGFGYYGDTGFCAGWEEGYKAGYCYEEYFCMAPVAPICPIPRIGEDTYQGGYNRGFIRGMKDKYK